MLFNSFEFLLLVVITFTFYYLPVFRKKQPGILLISSLVFYAYSQPWLLALLVLSMLLNAISSYKVYYDEVKRQRYWAVFGVVANLSILAFFKYSPLIGQTFFSEPSDIGDFLLHIPLPIGISFYTFQGISLVVDTFKLKDSEVYRSTIKPSLFEHIIRTSFFISFFPQLVAGPIVKAHHFMPQIGSKYIRNIRWGNTFRNIVVGFFLKMVVADNLNDYTFWITYPYFEDKSPLMLLTLLYGYSMQIFADFAGYSLIAIGVAELFGYQLPTNFLFPYISRSFSEFWRRWHISLSSFLKEYLYIPLGGNRKGPWRTYLNLFITMLLGGLWHGAAWSYAVWGAFHGLLLAAERFTKQLGLKPPSFPLGERILVFVCITLAWLLFKLPDFHQAIAYLECIIHPKGSGFNYYHFTYILLYGSAVVLYHLAYLYKDKIASYRNYMEPVALGIMLFLILTNAGSPAAFVYFQF